MLMRGFTITTMSIQDSNREILIEGNITVQSDGVKDELTALLNDCKNLKILFKNINKLDLAALQLVAALSKSAHQQNKKVEFTFEQTEYVKNILSLCGFDKFLAASI